MSAKMKSSLALLCMVMAVACLLGVFAIMDASSARANGGVRASPDNVLQPSIIISPTEMAAEMQPGSNYATSLWITNTGDADLAFTIYEISPTHKATAIHSPGSTIDSGFPAGPAPVDDGIREQLERWGSSRLIIYLRGKADFSAAGLISERPARVQIVYAQLESLASQSGDLYRWLVAEGTSPRRLLAANAIAATLDADQLEQVLADQMVVSVGINKSVHIISDDHSPMAYAAGLATLLPAQAGIRASTPDKVEWNIQKINADRVWTEFGITGQGAVIGIVDTGVDSGHPALANSYRGNLGGGNFDHNYSWYDLVNNQPAPYDDNNHGTFGAGIVVGDDGAGNQVGVAPGAQWIAVKALDAMGGGSLEQLLGGLDWMLAPTDLNGENPDPSKAPQVVLNMWGIPGCDHSFDEALAAYRAANILAVFAPGGEGPACGLVSSPAANPDALTAGSTDKNDLISTFSARGPSCYDGSIKPDVTAPGLEVRSSVPPDIYQTWSGTSLSTAHLAGAAALLFSANPSLDLDQLEQALFDTAVCIDLQNNCSVAACPDPNNTYGYGRIDAYQAVLEVLRNPPPVDLPWLYEDTISGTLPAGELSMVMVEFDSTGLEPGSYSGGLGILSNDPLVPFINVPVTLTVIAPCEPVNTISVSVTPTEPVTGEVITFTASAEGTPPITFTWDFADGTSAVGQTVTHIYQAAGSYQVVMFAENACSSPSVIFWMIVRQKQVRTLLPLVGR